MTLFIHNRCSCPCDSQSEPRNGPANLQAGRQQWRGHEGSQTGLAGWDQFDNASPVRNHKWAAHSRPSTGLVYMQARYYDPEVGRFTQWDPMPYGPEMAWGQNNRWAYCANDPVNCSDPSGLFVGGFFGVLLMAMGAAVIFESFTTLSSATGVVGLTSGQWVAAARVYGTAVFLGLGIFLLGLSWLMEDLGYTCFAKDLENLSIAAFALSSGIAMTGPRPENIAAFAERAMGVIAAAYVWLK